MYQPMLEVMQYLRVIGYKTFIVTGGGQDFYAFTWNGSTAWLAITMIGIDEWLLLARAAAPPSRHDPWRLHTFSARRRSIVKNRGQRMDGETPDFARGRDIIDMSNAGHVAQWTEIFDVTPGQLAAAIAVVGQQSADVKRYLHAFKTGGLSTAPT